MDLVRQLYKICSLFLIWYVNLVPCTKLVLIFPVAWMIIPCLVLKWTIYHIFGMKMSIFSTIRCAGMTCSYFRAPFGEIQVHPNLLRVWMYRVRGGVRYLFTCNSPFPQNALWITKYGTNRSYVIIPIIQIVIIAVALVGH